MMASNPLLRAVAATAVLLLSLPAASVAQTPPSPVHAASSAEASVTEARKRIRVGKFDEALAILRPLMRRQTVHADTVFQYGLAAIGASQEPGISEKKRDALLDEAIAAFHSMLVRRPELVRVRLELGRAFFLKDEDSLARQNFEQVLAGNPPAAVALNVNRFLAQIRALKRWVIRVGAALAPDSNLGAGSDERIIYIHGLPFRRDQEDLTKSGIGVSVWAGGEYQYPLDDRWRLRAGADISRREYRDNEFDQMSLSVHLGPRLLIGRFSEASLMASARQHWLANKPDDRELGIRTEFRRRLTPRMAMTLHGSWHERRYEERTHLDGSVMDVSLSASHAFGPTLRADLGVGWGRERPETERWRHDRRWLRAGITAALPWGFTVGASGTLRWADYEGNWFPFTRDGAPREDRTRILRATVHNRAFTLFGFSPQLVVTNEARDTNAQLYDYKRTRAELRAVRQF